MSFLNSEGFNKHLFYGLSMINDSVRNSFYKKMLEKNVKDKVCLDIGFGTGLLSIIACEAGARSVVAYEEDEETYNLGQYIIKELGLEGKITLIHDSIYSANCLDKHPEVEIVFTETINSTLWGESFLKFILPARQKPRFLPERYFLEVHALEVSKNFAQGLLEEKSRKFNPGIDISKNFIKIVNKIIDPNYKNQTLDNGLHNVNFYNHNNFWGSMQKVIDVYDLDSRIPTVGYSMDVNTQSLRINSDEETFVSRNTTVKFDLDLLADKTYLIVTRTGISYEDKKLYLDKAHWGEFPQHAIVVNPQDRVTIEHNLFDGNFFISYKDQKICLIKEERSEEYQHIIETEKIKVIKFTA